MPPPAASTEFPETRGELARPLWDFSGRSWAWSAGGPRPVWAGGQCPRPRLQPPGLFSAVCPVLVTVCPRLGPEPCPLTPDPSALSDVSTVALDRGGHQEPSLPGKGHSAGLSS